MSETSAPLTAQEISDKVDGILREHAREFVLVVMDDEREFDARYTSEFTAIGLIEYLREYVKSRSRSAVEQGRAEEG